MTRLLISCLAASVVAAPVLAQSLTWIDAPAPFRDTIPLGVSGNGQVVFGYYQSGSSQAAVAFRWTRSGGTVRTAHSNDVSSFVTSASHDGTVLAGYARRGVFPPVALPTSHAALWESNHPIAPDLLVMIGDGTSTWTPGRGGWLVSGDGQTVIGVSDAVLNGSVYDFSYFRSSGSAGPLPLAIPGDPVSVNVDGSAIIGNRHTHGATADDHVYRWTEATGVVDILDNAVVEAANAEGTALAVRIGANAFRWDQGLRLVSLGPVHGAAQMRVEPRGISSDGSVIVGALLQQTPSGAFIWTDRIGLWDLQSLLPRMGITGVGPLLECTGVSADGRTIVGSALVAGAFKGFVLTVPQCSSADFNNDGDSGTDADIEAFFACLAGNCCTTCWWLGADINSDGDPGTDADVEAFFRVLAGNSC